jgi:hypothetical protein
LGFEIPENTWIEFASCNKAEATFHTDQSKAADYFWSLRKADAFEIRFYWAVSTSGGLNRMQILSRTDFLFPVKNASEVDLRIYKRQFLSGISMLFINNKTKCGDEELDKKYVFVCKPKAMIHSMIHALRIFDQQSDGEDFLIEMDEGNLLIQVNRILKETLPLETFFNLGIALQEKINKARII